MNRQSKAHVLMRQHLWEEALPILKRDALATPEDPWPLMYIGCCYYELRDYDSSLEYTRQATALAPRSSTVVGLEGDVYCAIGDYPRAEQRYRHALELDSDDPLAKKNWRWFQGLMEEKRELEEEERVAVERNNAEQNGAPDHSHGRSF